MQSFKNYCLVGRVLLIFQVLPPPVGGAHLYNTLSSMSTTFLDLACLPARLVVPFHGRVFSAALLCRRMLGV